MLTLILLDGANLLPVGFGVDVGFVANGKFWGFVYTSFVLIVGLTLFGYISDNGNGDIRY